MKRISAVFIFVLGISMIPISWFGLVFFVCEAWMCWCRQTRAVSTKTTQTGKNVIDHSWRPLDKPDVLDTELEGTSFSIEISFSANIKHPFIHSWGSGKQTGHQSISEPEHHCKKSISDYFLLILNFLVIILSKFNQIDIFDK